MKVDIAWLVAVAITVLGCDVEDNDILTGLNPGCNYAGVCMQFTAKISKCVCCAPEYSDDSNICGKNWICDPSSPSFHCYRFSANDCTEVTRYLYVNLAIWIVNGNQNQAPDITCSKQTGELTSGILTLSSHNLVEHVQDVVSSKGWPGVLKPRVSSHNLVEHVQDVFFSKGWPGVLKPGGSSKGLLGARKPRGLCNECTNEAPCAFRGESVTAGFTTSFQVDFNLYYDLDCAVDYWIYDQVVFCEANYDNGQSAYFSWKKSIGEASNFIDILNDYLRLKGWSHNKVAGMHEVFAITRDDVILAGAPTIFPTAAPTSLPTKKPTAVPTLVPFKNPTANPTSFPTSYPTHSPTPAPTDNPTPVPTRKPSFTPTNFPTDRPTSNPTRSPTDRPSRAPTKSPTKRPTSPPTNEPALAFYRYYNSGIVDHFYTTNWNELGAGRDGWRYEGIQCKIYKRQVPGTIPLYRYWGNSDHFYTTNINEIGTATHGKVGKYGYISEGVAGYCYPSASSNLVPLHRFWYPNPANHFYTTSYSEGTRASYKYEGVACYVPESNPTKSPTKMPMNPPTNEHALAFYRYYNSGIVDHFYTTNWNELGGGRDGWRYEGIQCKIYKRQVLGTIPLYRYWGNNDHFYTTNINEIGTATHGKVGKYGYKSEGVAGYCYPSHVSSNLVPLYRFWDSRRVNHFYTTSYSEGTRASYRDEGVACYVLKK